MAENKVTLLQQQILKLTKEINKNGEATKKQAKELEKLKKEYSELNSKQMPQYRKRHEEITKELEKANRLTKKATEGTKNFGTRIKGAVKTLGAYGIAYRLINAATRLFTELTIGSAKQAIEFEKQVANLGAVAGVSGEKLKELSENALDVAGSTRFTATEIIGLQTALAKLGFTSEDVIKSTQSIANVAQALGSPLDATAEQIGKVINQFDLLIEQTDFVGDVLVTTINNSALSFDSFGTAIQYVGPIAKNLGLTFEQTAGAMAVLADNGFTASRVGTGLRGIFTELGKTSADVEKSLKSLAEQNISLSEAVELVGKRNAAQLITLLDNIEALEEGTGKYYEQGRALASSAQQLDTFSGQMSLLNSAFRETQIRFGSFILESDLVLDVLGLLSREAEGLGRAMKSINELGFTKFNEGVESVLAGDIEDEELAIELVAKRTGESIEEITKKYKAYRDGVIESTYDPTIGERRDMLIKKTTDEAVEVEGLVEEINKLVEAREKDFAISQGQAEATKIYSKEVEDLVNKSLEGVNVNKEADKLYKDLQAGINSYSRALNYNKNLTELQRVEYEAAIKTLKGYQDQVANTQRTEEDLSKERERARKKAISEEKKRIQDAIKFADIEFKNQEDSINRQAELRTTAQQQILESETATNEERRAAIEAIADIEEKRQQDVSEAYKRKAEAIQQITIQYEENERVIDAALLKAQQYAVIYDNDIVKDASSALKNFRAETSRLTKEREAGNISQEEYNTAIQRTQDDFEVYIKNLIASNNLGEDAEKILLNMVDAFDRMGISIGNIGGEAAVTSLKEFADKLRNDEEFRREFFGDLMSKSVDAAAESFSAFNDVALENTKNRLESELEEIKNRYKIEEDILKASLDNQIITENQYRAKQKELQKAQIAEENALNKQIFEAEKKQDRNDAIIDGTAAAAQAFVNAWKTGEPITAQARAVLSASIIAAQTVAQVAAINSRKFFPVKYESGGMVNGPSHSSGGVPFTVQGQAGYEMEGGEFIVNKKATAMHRDLLERINGSEKTNPRVGKTYFQSGGLVSAVNNESVNYLKAIAEATTSTAISSSKPVRAFISSKDLRSNENERRLRDRNDRI
jgi:hypothetical protein